MSEAILKQQPEEVINRIRPNHRSIQQFEGGDNRYVFVVDGVEAFRFPKNESGAEVGHYEFEALKLVYGKLSVEVPRPIELAPDGAYNVLGFLQGNVLRKHDVVELPFEKRRNLGIAVAGIINELNTNITKDDLAVISTRRSLIRNRDDYYAGIYETAKQQVTNYEAAYRKNYELLQQVRPGGSASNVIVFGDFSSPNLVLSDDNELKGVIDWTELGLGDIHNELRPVFSVIGQQAFEEMVASINPELGPINQDLVRLLAVVHELTILVTGKQTGQLTPERTKLAEGSLNQWLDEGWAD
ncbi:aminoglycoside phosphotransferase family protein [Candidatus Saccharibacteria bacterium]|nr:aminoglycoside phosphotransferase family protein [Candidatus Saccharibacteria bacterium]